MNTIELMKTVLRDKLRTCLGWGDEKQTWRLAVIEALDLQSLKPSDDREANRLAGRIIEVSLNIACHEEIRTQGVRIQVVCFNELHYNQQREIIQEATRRVAI